MQSDLEGQSPQIENQLSTSQEELEVRRPTIPAFEGLPLVKTGHQQFLQASSRYPSCAPAQAAFIARSCQNNENLSPAILKDAILDSNEALLNIRDFAEFSHTKAMTMRDRKEMRPLRAPGITTELVIGMIKSDFDFAEEMMILEPSELDFILNNRYPFYKELNEKERINNPGSDIHNHEFAKEIEELIKTKRPEQIVQQKSRHWYDSILRR